MIKILGAKTIIENVDTFLEQISNFSDKNNLVIQAFNADVIYGKSHLISAVHHAQRAFERKINTTNSIEKEILLYASGERRLKLAIPKIGVVEGNVNVVFVFIGDIISNKHIYEFITIFCLIKDEKVIEGDENTLKRFGLNELEIKTVNKNNYSNLILEKVAMVDIIK